MNLKLLHDQRNQVFVTASSSIHGGYPENLISGSMWAWRSNDQIRSWVQFNFPHVKIKISKYSLKSGFTCLPKSWELMGSNDGVLFITIDKQIGFKFMKNLENREFSCDGQQFFSIFRIVQTDENQSGNFCFSLKSVDFCGFVV
jgi:hypothetical protein